MNNIGSSFLVNPGKPFSHTFFSILFRRFPYLRSPFGAMILFLLWNIAAPLSAQTDSVAQKPEIRIDYMLPKEYEIGGISIKGADRLDEDLIILYSGLTVGEKITIPGDKISEAVDKMWKQGYFEDIQLSVTKIEGRTIYLEFDFKTKPAMRYFTFTGAGGDGDKLREKINLVSGNIVTENLKMTTLAKIKDFYIDKGYHNCEVSIKENKDTNSTRGDVNLNIIINKGKRVKVQQIIVHNNKALTDSQIRKSMPETKQRAWWRFWKKSMYSEHNFRQDLKSVIERYNKEGYRNARIVSDTVYKLPNGHLQIEITVNEGNKFYFGDITWSGNTKYSSEDLTKRLRIKKGDPYNSAQLQQNLTYDPTGVDISSLYQDDGYLFFQAIPTEVRIHNDSIDIDIRLHEGKQARIGRVNIVGNERTNDHVIRRELRTYPGDLYSRDAVLRSIRELNQLQYFTIESLQAPEIVPDQQKGTVDITYNVEEKSFDRLELSGGWGGYSGLLGTIGVNFTNFSMRNLFNKKAWRPLPVGDGQSFAVRAQSNGQYYHNLSASFTEPWLGGHKPNALTTSVYYTYMDNGWYSRHAGQQYVGIFGASVSLGMRLKKPDDYFTLIHGLSFQHYDLKDYPGGFIFKTGNSNNINYRITLGRNSIDDPIFPRLGSDVSLSGQFTPPYSLLNQKDYSVLSDKEKYRWLEYYKLSFRVAWYFNPVADLVFAARARFGFLGSYNPDIGTSPFERFYLGGDGLTGWGMDGREIIGMRGYVAEALSPDKGAAAFNKFTFEIRYPITLSPMLSLYVLTFLEAGNSWASFQQVDPFQTYKSAGIGLRLFMPQFGLIGLDWGYGFDPVTGRKNANGSQFHFSLNQSID